MNQEIYLGGRRIAADAPVFIVAEMSANHLQDYNRAIEIIHAEAIQNKQYFLRHVHYHGL